MIINNLKRILEAKGFSATRLSVDTDINRNTINQIVGNKLTTLNIEHINKICNTLGIRINDLYTYYSYNYYVEDLVIEKDTNTSEPNQEFVGSFKLIAETPPFTLKIKTRSDYIKCDGGIETMDINLHIVGPPSNGPLGNKYTGYLYFATLDDILMYQTIINEDESKGYISDLINDIISKYWEENFPNEAPIEYVIGSTAFDNLKGKTSLLDMLEILSDIQAR